MTLSATPLGLLRGTSAESFERFRLGCPDQVVDRTLAYARGRVTRALEVGAGTGKASRAFASRGLRVTALEPDPDMHTVLRRETIGLPVEPVCSVFEEHAGPPYDLLYASGSWQRTGPAMGWSHARDLLVDGGVVALFGSPLRVVDPRVRAAVTAVRPALDERLPAWLAGELDASPFLTDVQHHRLARQVVLPQREYLGYLSTLPAYLELDLEVAQDLLRRIAGIVPAQVRVDLSVDLHLARRA
jgi:SAM-dependent methyltransferase